VTPYSSEVKLTLLVSGHELNVAQVSKDFLILRERVVIAGPCNAVLAISIDGEVDNQKLQLPCGIDAESERIAYLKIK
jgi:hypothetical protein